MKRDILIRVEVALAILVSVVTTGFLSWHDAQKTLPAEKRSDFVMSVVVIQATWMLCIAFRAFRYRKDREKFILNLQSLRIPVALPLILLFALSWYLNFWPGPYR